MIIRGERFTDSLSLYRFKDKRWDVAPQGSQVQKWLGLKPDPSFDVPELDSDSEGEDSDDSEGIRDTDVDNDETVDPMREELFRGGLQRLGITPAEFDDLGG